MNEQPLTLISKLPSQISQIFRQPIFLVFVTVNELSKEDPISFLALKLFENCLGYVFYQKDDPSVFWSFFIQKSKKKKFFIKILRG